MNQTVFLTGATGALGPTVAAELLASRVAARLYVLIRPGDLPAAIRFNRWIETLEGVLAASGGLLPNPRKRVSLISGDLCSDQLGLSSADAETLRHETNVIIHCAADTSFRARGQTHWETNVEGTRRILELAGECRNLRKLIHVSTICSAGVQTGLVREIAIDHEPDFANGYERTKWQAEHLVLSSQLPAEIVRVGIVMGSSITGAVHRLGAVHHVLKWIGTGMMPVIPGRPNTPVDLIDSELPAKLICKAATSASNPGAIYHAAAGRRAALLRDVAPFCRAHLLENNDDDASLLSHHEQHSAQHERLAKAWLPVLLAGRTYDTTRAEALWGGPLPLAHWEQTLEKVVEFCGFTARQRASVG